MNKKVPKQYFQIYIIVCLQNWIQIFEKIIKNKVYDSFLLLFIEIIILYREKMYQKKKQYLIYEIFIILDLDKVYKLYTNKSINKIVYHISYQKKKLKYLKIYLIFYILCFLISYLRILVFVIMIFEITQFIRLF